jgi:hypothetical protein
MFNCLWRYRFPLAGTEVPLFLAVSFSDEVDEDAVLDDIYETSTTANNPAIPAMHSLRNAHTFPILSSICIILSVIDVFFNDSKNCQCNEN